MAPHQHRTDVPSCSGAIFQLDEIIMVSFPQCPRAVDESHWSGGGRECVRENKHRLVCQISLIISLINFNNSPIALLPLAFTYWLFVHINRLWPFYAQNGINWKEHFCVCLEVVHQIYFKSKLQSIIYHHYTMVYNALEFESVINSLIRHLPCLTVNTIPRWTWAQKYIKHTKS